MADIASQITEHLICPISGQIFFDPVIASDGHTYEKYCIEKWFENNSTSPITNLVIKKNMVSNYITKNIIQKLIDNNMVKKEQIFKNPKRPFNYSNFKLKPNDFTYVKKIIDESILNLPDGDGDYPIHILCKFSTFEIIKYAIETYVPDGSIDMSVKDEHGCCPIKFIIDSNNIDAFKYVVEKEFNIYAKNNDGSTPLHYIDSIEILEYVINKNIDINVTDNYGLYPIHNICKTCNVELVKFAIEKNINMNVVANNGLYPIHYICNKGNFDLIKFAIEKGINMNVTTSDGWKPIHFICKHGDHGLIQYAIDKGL